MTPFKLFKYSLLIYMCLGFTVIEKPNKSFVNLIMKSIKNGEPVLCVINVFEESNNKLYEVSISSELLYFYFKEQQPEKENYLFYKEIKEAINCHKITVKNSIIFKKHFEEYVIDPIDYNEIVKNDFATIIKDNFTKSYFVNKERNKKRFNAVVKLLFEKKILVYQDDFSGLFCVSQTPLIKSILNNN